MRKAAVLGYWAAIACTVFAIAYSIAQILSVAGVLHFPSDLVTMFIPSLLLAPCFLVVMVCLSLNVERAGMIFPGLGVAFAILYTAMATLVYFTQLSSTIPLAKSIPGFNDPLSFSGKSFTVAIDCLAYAFMSLSTFFTAFAFITRLDRWLFRGLLIHGLLSPFILLSFFFPVLLPLGALWMITFPFAMIQVIRLFYRRKEEVASHVYDEVEEVVLVEELTQSLI
jgi:hypothetical protein